MLSYRFVQRDEAPTQRNFNQNNFTPQTRPSLTLGDILSLSLSLLLPLWSTGKFLNLGQSVGHLGLGISPSQGRYLHKHRINADKHPCLEWDSNPWSQCSSGRRHFMPWIARPLWSAGGYYGRGISFTLKMEGSRFLRKADKYCIYQRWPLVFFSLHCFVSYTSLWPEIYALV
jgi:hypothetical protein